MASPSRGLCSGRSAGRAFCSSLRLASRALSSSFDSGEPFCRSQIVAAANRANWRYSDCQFSVTA